MLHKIFIVFLLFTCSSSNEEHWGRVVRVIDGDTIEVLLSKPTQKKIKVRLYAIDAPERGQAFNVKARENLASLVANKTVKLVVNRKDQYGRTVADVYLEDDTYVNAALIKAGYAWHYKEFSNDKELARLEVIARKQKLGLWHDVNPVAPWEYRKRKRK